MKLARLHIRLGKDLKEAMAAYVLRKGTTVSALIESYFLELLIEEKRAQQEEIEPGEQI